MKDCMIELGMGEWKTYEDGIRKEWLITNGIGGFASSTVTGANTRRYHGLLVASLKPPVERHLILSKIDESVTVGNNAYNLYSFKTPGYTMNGYRFLQRFIGGDYPIFIYSIGDIIIEKKVCMVYGENTVVIIYNVKTGMDPITLKLAPLMNFRNYHHTIDKSYLKFNTKISERQFILNPVNTDIEITVSLTTGINSATTERNSANGRESKRIFKTLEDCYFENMEYEIERERGLSSIDNHYVPGYFEIDLMPHTEKIITITASVEKEHTLLPGKEVIAREEKRIADLVNKSGAEDPFAIQLVKAADKFIVYRKSTDACTIIAGYPWFTDWGRDAMIAFTGLALATKRFEEAGEILLTFAKYIRNGLIPNLFPDEGQEPAYNSVDASLWFFEAINKYIVYTGNHKFIRAHLYNVMEAIISSYINGTDFEIKMDRDFLISAGNFGTQLTWMDAKAGEWVVTPRHGKAVEINSLWYNALMIMASLQPECNSIKTNSKYNYLELAENVKKSFISKFWNDKKQCLFDVINEDGRDSRIRPNQIFAVSLSYPVITGEMAVKIIDVVWKELYATYGLRSLAANEEGYMGRYEGDQFKRDSAYHQGTVWAWLIGHFITAFLKSRGYSQDSKKWAMKLIEPFKDHMKDACVGSISEIFDGESPHLPRGCFAQAWSVGELLRVYSEIKLK